MLKQNKDDHGTVNSSWYDKATSFAEYNKHYTESRYYYIWSVIVDRICNAEYRSNRILDIGCGPAQISVLLRDRGIEFYHGVDFSPKLLELAKKILHNINLL